MSRSYKQRDLKLLWGLSGGICAFTECQKSICEPETNDIIGHIAHIVADSPDGPRGNVQYPTDMLNSYENLILLCPTHHAIIDAKNSSNTIAEIKKMKKDHEGWVKKQLSLGEPWISNVSQYYYLNIPRLAILAASFNIEVDLQFLDSSQSLHSLGWELNSIVLEFKKILEIIHPSATDIDQINEFIPEQIGSTLSFNSNFRAKGIPSPQEADSFKLTGDVIRDPQIYKKFREYRFIMTVNPKWITFATAFVNLSGHVSCAGLCTIKGYDPDKKYIIATPLILGIPKSPFDNIF